MDLQRPIGRRPFLKAAGLGAIAYLVGGCVSATPTTTPAASPATQTPVPSATATAIYMASPSATATSASVASGATGTRPVIRMLGNPAQGMFEAPQPFTIRTGPGAIRSELIFDSLLWRDSTLQPIPWLAESWTSVTGDMEWTFRLRDGLKFQDGKPLTADDVAFSYEYIAANKPGFYSSLVDVLAGAQVVDERSVRISLKAPYAPFLNGIAATTPVLPKHIWSTVTDPAKFTDKSAYVGSGAYRLAEMNEAEGSFLFEANDSFFLGKPYVGRIEFIPVGDELVALKAGNIDMANPSANPSATMGVPNEVLSYFKADPKYAILQGPGEVAAALHFNLSHGAPYDNVSFRQAVVYAVDRQDLVKRVLGGNGDVGSAGFLSPGNPFANKNVESYAYDPQRAKSLLDEAGYKEQDGQRRLPDGSPLGITLLLASSNTSTAELLRSQLAVVGVKVDFKPVDPATAMQLQTAGNYDVSLVTYGGLGSDPDFLRQTYDSPAAAKFWWKAWGYSNPELTRLGKEQMQATDENKRRELVNEMQVIVATDVPLMPLFYPTRFVIYVPAVFDDWYFTPLWKPLPTNKHAFITGQKTGLSIRQS